MRDLTYKVEAGRCILKNGVRFITIGKCEGTSPVDADEITHVIAQHLNEAEVVDEYILSRDPGCDRCGVNKRTVGVLCAHCAADLCEMCRVPDHETCSLDRNNGCTCCENTRDNMAAYESGRL